MDRGSFFRCLSGRITIRSHNEYCYEKMKDLDLRFQLGIMSTSDCSDMSDHLKVTMICALWRTLYFDTRTQLQAILGHLARDEIYDAQELLRDVIDSLYLEDITEDEIRGVWGPGEK